MPVNALATSGSIVGPNKYGPTGGVATGISLYDMYTAAEFQELGLPVGYRIERLNGNVFRLAYFEASLNRGVLVAPDMSAMSVVDTDNQVDAAEAIGQTTIHMDGAAFASISVNQFAEGILVTTDDTGEGFSYPIKSNTVTASTDEIDIVLYEGIIIALDTTTDVAIIGNPYNGMIIATAATDYIPKGVSVNTIVQGTEAYGWIQTKGMVGILQDGAITDGDQVSLSDATDGAVEVLVASGATAWVGHCVITGDTTGHGVFDIFLE